MKFSTTQQKLRKRFDESIDSVRRQIPLYRITKRFAWLPTSDSLKTFWLEDIYVAQELELCSGFFMHDYIDWVDKKFSTKEAYEQYLKDNS